MVEKKQLSHIITTLSQFVHISKQHIK